MADTSSINTAGGSDQPDVKNKMHIIIISGMSGAGKTQCTNALEDIGYFCVDNLPLDLFMKFISSVLMSQGAISRVAVVTDIRGGNFLSQIEELLDNLKGLKSQYNIDYQMIFLDASDEVLVRRFEETRRKHPLTKSDDTVLDSIRDERRRLANFKGLADMVIDTSNLRARDLSAHITELFAQDMQEVMAVSLVSFGYKYGLPIDVDLVMDVRFLPNPHYIPELRPLTGQDKQVYKFVMEQEASKKFVAHYVKLLEFLLPYYRNEGKRHLTIAIGCTGGRHRSVSIARALAKKLEQKGYHPALQHRDIKKADQKY